MPARLEKWMKNGTSPTRGVFVARRADDASCVDLRFVPSELRLEQFSSPVLERRSAFRKRVIDAVKVAIKELCDDAIAQGLEMGLKPVEVHNRVRRKGVSPDPGRHYTWLARYQVRGELSYTIADGKEHAGKGTIVQAVELGAKNLAAQIGLTLRSKHEI